MNRRDFLRASSGGLVLGLNRAVATPPEPGELDAAARVIQAQVDSGRLDAAVLYVRRGTETFQRAFGKAGTPDAIFLLASFTKPMTAAGLMILVDRGELELSDPVMKFIPEFSEGDRKLITIKQLLTHTSGLPDQLPENAELRRSHAPMEEFVRHAVRTPLLFKPGTRYKYQSMGILLAAEVAQRITVTPLRDFLKKELLDPLQMKRSALGLGPFKLAETVRCQTESAAPESGAGSPEARDWDWNSLYWRNFGAPWGGAHASAPDVARFLESFLQPDGKVLRQATARSMVRNHNQELDTPCGLGFAIGSMSFGRHSSDRTFGHGGSTGTLAWADPSKSLTCVILTSLPARVSGELILRPVSDIVSGSGV